MIAHIYKTPFRKSSHIYTIPKTVAHLCQSTILMVNHLLLLPWCMVINSYWISSNGKQQPTAGYWLHMNKQINTRCKSANQSENHHK